LALLDLQMPEMDGLEAVALIRQNEKATGRCRLPVIALTAHAMRGDRERCIAAGMDGYISKPINRKELFTVIQNVLQTYHPATNPVLPPDDRPFSRRPRVDPRTSPPEPGLSVSHILCWTRGVAVRIEAPKGRNSEAQAKRPGSENTPYLPGSPERARYQPRATRFRGLAEAPVTYRAPLGLEDDPSG